MINLTDLKAALETMADLIESYIKEFAKPECLERWPAGMALMDLSNQRTSSRTRTTKMSVPSLRTDLSNHEEFRRRPQRDEIAQMFRDIVKMMRAHPALDHPSIEIKVSFHYRYKKQARLYVAIDDAAITRGVVELPTFIKNIGRLQDHLTGYPVEGDLKLYNVDERTIRAHTPVGAALKYLALYEPQNLDPSRKEPKLPSVSIRISKKQLKEDFAALAR
jgi:hypothetical protein